MATAKLLDAWSPPPEAGVPVGCLTTSFTFSPVLYEEECLGRFVGMESHPEQDGAIYLVEREERLAGIVAAALVDARHCRGRRSLRWDLILARVPGGRAMHAKVSLLCWSRLVRVIVASANLTDDGARRNQEVFGVLDYFEGCEAPKDVLKDVLGFLDAAANYASGPAVDRWLQLSTRAGKLAGDWGVTSQSRSAAVRPILVRPGSDSAIEQLATVWPDLSSRPTLAKVVSPFFDPDVETHVAGTAVWGKLLRIRGPAHLEIHTTAEPSATGRGVRIHAPASLLNTLPSGRSDVSLRFFQVKEHDRPSEQGPLFRPLHAKALWLENDRFAGLMLGSSNFTAAGLGLAQSPNVEANLFYCVADERERNTAKLLAAAFIDGEPLDDAKLVEWAALRDETDAGGDDVVVLPSAFREAVFKLLPSGKQVVELVIDGTPPNAWRVLADGTEQVVADEQRWKATGRPSSITVEWPEETVPPAGFEVAWEGAHMRAWWPVNVVDANALPPPAELRGLTLDALISILTSARPLKDALRGWLQRRERKDGDSNTTPNQELDPLRRFSSTAFLLQRTRRVSFALRGLRDRLEAPAPTKEAFAWRLTGPVGVRALIRALEKEKRGADEFGFLLAEIALELSRIRPKEAPGSISAAQLRKQILAFMSELKPEIEAAAKDASPSIRSYVIRALGNAVEA